MNLPGKRRLIAEDIIQRHLWRTDQVLTNQRYDFDKDVLDVMFLKLDIMQAMAKARREGMQVTRRPKRRSTRR